MSNEDKAKQDRRHFLSVVGRSAAAIGGTLVGGYKVGEEVGEKRAATELGITPPEHMGIDIPYADTRVTVGDTVAVGAMAIAVHDDISERQVGRRKFAAATLPAAVLLAASAIHGNSDGYKNTKAAHPKPAPKAAANGQQGDKNWTARTAQLDESAEVPSSKSPPSRRG